MSLFQKITFASASGRQLDWKIECDHLTESDWACLAFIVSQKVKFDRVVGVPRGGLHFAEALQEFRTVGIGHTLIVDDVLTTGKSMELVRAGVEGHSVGVVVFARGACPDWITPIFRLSDEMAR